MSSTDRERLLRLGPICVLVLLAFAPVWRAVFLGEAIGPVDQIAAMTGGPRAATPWNALQADALLQFRGWRSLVLEAWRGGALPTWNPYSLLGTPLLANSQSGGLYPPHIVVGIARVPLDSAIGLLAWFHLAMAGVGAYRLARAVGADRAGAFFGGSGFMISAFVLAWTPLASVPSTVAWIPWILYGIERRTAVVVGPAVGMMLLAGHLQFAAYGLIAAGVYALARTRWLSFPALAAGAAIAGASLLPTLAFSARSHRRGAATEEGYAAYARSAIQPWQLDVLGSPAADGLPQRAAPIAGGGVGGYWPSAVKVGENFAEAAIGISPFAFALLAAAPWRDRRVRGLFAAGTVGLLLAMPTGLSRVLYFGVPGWSATGSPGRAGVLFVLAGSVLAGVGLTRLRSQDRKKPIFIATAGLGASLLLLTTIPGMAAPPDGLRLGAGIGSWRSAAAGFALPLTAGFVGAGLLLLGYPSARKWSWAAAGLPAAYAGLTYGPGLVPTGPYPVTDVPRSAERVAVTNARWSFFQTPDALWPPNSLLPTRTPTAEGYDSLIDRDTKRLLDEANGGDSAPPENGNMMLIKPSASDERLRGLGVSTRWERGEDGRLTRREIGGRMVGGGRLAIRPDGFDLIGAPTGPVTIRQRNLPGWSVDGAPTSPGDWIVVPDGPAGRTARLRYEPPGMRRGAIVSAAGLVATAFLVAAETRRRVRKNQDATKLASKEAPGV